MRIVIVYFQPNSWFYIFGLKCFLVVLLVWVYSFRTFLKLSAWPFAGFLSLRRIFFQVITFFYYIYWFLRNSTSGSWFSFYALGCCFSVGGNKFFTFTKFYRGFNGISHILSHPRVLTISLTIHIVITALYVALLSGLVAYLIIPWLSYCISLAVKPSFFNQQTYWLFLPLVWLYLF